MFDLKEFDIVPRGRHWPAGEGLISASASGEPVAVIRAEPWPEVWERPWPDGALRRPLLWRLLGVDRNPQQSRTIVRRLEDGYPLARLHRRAPLFWRTVGVFDGDDRRVGYCRWAFKGTGPQDAFSVARADHSLCCEVRRAGEAEYHVSGAAGGVWAVVTMSGRGSDAVRRVSIAEATVGAGRDGVLLLAAVVVLAPLECRVRAEPDATPDPTRT